MPSGIMNTSCWQDNRVPGMRISSDIMYDTQDLNNVSWKFTNPIHNEQANSLLNNKRSDVS